jgi:hypothetical protein
MLQQTSQKTDFKPAAELSHAPPQADIPPSSIFSCDGEFRCSAPLLLELLDGFSLMHRLDE